MDARKVLVLAPHTDDAELGCGGTLARFVEDGLEVHVAVFSTAAESVPAGEPPDTLRREFLEAIPRLGVLPENLTVYDYPVRRLSYHRQEVLEHIVALRRRIGPDLVLLPSVHDLHQDHTTVHEEGMRACKDISVLGYELPWNSVTFDAQAFFVLEERHVKRKWEALQYYRSQIKLNRPYFTPAFIEGLAKVRGVQVKATYAEAFEVMRVKW
jgi:N-acetylglucosamine malate deacetylase 1